MDASQCIVVVPHLGPIDPECEGGLRELQKAAITVVRRPQSAKLDVARSELLSSALHDGFESILCVDPDIGFDPADALRLLASPEPVISGVYARTDRQELASVFADGIEQIWLGPGAPDSYPLKHAAAGFLRIRGEVLRR